MIDECPMSGDCPGYDRDRRVCLLHRDDCEFSSRDGEAAPLPGTSEVLARDASAEAAGQPTGGRGAGPGALG